MDVVTKSVCKLPPVLALFVVWLFVPAPSVHAQTSNWCGAGTSSANDPLAPANFPTVAPSGVTSSLWTTDTLSKYIQTAPNTATSSKSVLFCAARNEFADAQIHYVNSTGSPVTLNYSVSDLVLTVSPGTHISASTNITVYGERYYTVNALSDANGIGTGPIPDALVPNVEPYHAQTTNEFPIAVANGNTQSLWYDVLVPASAPSGYYTGTIAIAVNGSTLATLPVVLAVWNFTIPSTSSLKTVYDQGGPLTECSGYYGVNDGSNGYNQCGSLPGAGANSDTGMTLTLLDAAYLLLDHRLSAGQIVWPAPVSPPNTWTVFDTNYGPLLNGTSTHTILSGAALTSIDTQDAPGTGGMSSSNVQDWVNHFQTKGWLGKLYGYICDEPGNDSSMWTNCASRAAVADTSSPILPTLITANIANATNNYAGSNPAPPRFINYMIVQSVDMDSVYSSGPNLRSTYNNWLAGSSGSFSTQAGPYIGLYSGCSNHGSCSNGSAGGTQFGYPSNMIDATGVRNRMMPWIDYSDNVSIELYYATGYCWIVSNVSSCQDGKGNSASVPNPWAYQYAFGGNGDGTLLYPGTYSMIGGNGYASSTWVPIPIASIRLKHERDGLQDYEYMHMLNSMGYGSFVTTQLKSFITNDYTFKSTNGIGCTSCLMAARNAMGNQLHQLSLQAPARPASPTGLTILIQ